MKSEMSNRAPLEQHVPRRISVETTPQEHAVAVTTQEALDGYREKSDDASRMLKTTHCTGCRFRRQEHST